MYAYIACVIFITLFEFTYLTYYFRRTALYYLHDRPEGKTYIWLAAAFAAMIAAYAGFPWFDLHELMIIFFTLASLAADILTFFISGTSDTRSARRWQNFHESGRASVLFFLLIIVYAFLTQGDVVVSRYTVETSKKLEGGSLRIAAIADTHMGKGGPSLTKLAKYCSVIEDNKPDMTVLLGDIFDEMTPKAKMEETCKILGSIKSPLGVFYVYGNHDSGILASGGDIYKTVSFFNGKKGTESGHKTESSYAGSGVNPRYSRKEMSENLTRSGITILSDRAVKPRKDIFLIGRADRDAAADRKKTSDYTRECGKDDFIILLDHQPVESKKNAADGADLQLSGHTHGGQLWFLGEMQVLLGNEDLQKGEKHIGSMDLIVSTGLGAWDYPLRLGSKPEVVIIDIKTKR